MELNDIEVHFLLNERSRLNKGPLFGLITKPRYRNSIPAIDKDQCGLQL